MSAPSGAAIQTGQAAEGLHQRQNVKSPSGKTRKLRTAGLPFEKSGAPTWRTNQKQKLNEGRVIVSRDALLQWLQCKSLKETQQQHRPRQL